MTPRFVVLGNPENRRVSLFQDALAAEGLAPALVLSWIELLVDRRLELPDGPAFVRIDSFGESFEVERRLLERGGRTDAMQLVERRGEVLTPAVSHAGFRDVLQGLEATFAERPDLTMLNVPAEIDELFDKRRTSRRFLAQGIPVPEPMEDPPEDPAELLERLSDLGWSEAFVKLSSGSSASCLAQVSFDDEGVLVRTSLEWAAPRWFNNLKVRHLRAVRDVHRALGFILSQGAQVERGVPKARLADAFFDLRVLSIAGEPRFVVVRQNTLPITNLHLGGWRGDLDALKARVGSQAWEAAMATCRSVARLYRSLHVGIDLMFEADFVGHRVLEANAFGDLLPNLTLDGASVWQWEIREALRQARATTMA
ncbi:MAG: STM4014 family protein [Myxococcaceae bacterium]|nr:STM4014 family protein [Myxococcaceae bacterium]